ncbi:unnamed protein product, partial [Hapterophycus canaliculatus]
RGGRRRGAVRGRRWGRGGQGFSWGEHRGAGSHPRGEGEGTVLHHRQSFQARGGRPRRHRPAAPDRAQEHAQGGRQELHAAGGLAICGREHALQGFLPGTSTCLPSCPPSSSSSSKSPEARRNSTFAVSDFPASWPVPSSGWVDEFLKLTGPELVRIPIPATFEGLSEGSGTFRAWAFLREWAQLWTAEGTGLTTPV